MKDAMRNWEWRHRKKYGDKKVQIKAIGKEGMLRNMLSLKYYSRVANHRFTVFTLLLKNTKFTYTLEPLKNSARTYMNHELRLSKTLNISYTLYYGILLFLKTKWYVMSLLSCPRARHLYRINILHLPCHTMTIGVLKDWMKRMLCTPSL